MFHQPRRRPTQSFLSLGCLLSALIVNTEAFVAPLLQCSSTKTKSLSHSYSYSQPICLAAAFSNNKEDDSNEDDDNINKEEDWNTSELPPSLDPNLGPDKSRMVNFISNFLNKEANDEDGDEGNTTGISSDNNTKSKSSNAAFTHLIAIPMGDAHELAIELESVQRAILYHCPVLVHACVVAATTRLPLLYVQAPPALGISQKDATDQLHRIVGAVVQKHINVAPEVNTDVVQVDENGVLQKEPLDGINNDGIRPLALTFQSLEIDGPNNQVLSTVALPDDPGTRRLQQFVMELQTVIATELPGWETSLPPDDHIASGSVSDDDDDDIDTDNGDTNRHKSPAVLRPRVPFMRIPSNFKNYLDPLPKDQDDELLRTSDQGGNGISPIFWASWWDDVFGTTRLREIGIYPRVPSMLGAVDRSGGTSLGEDAFHIPFQVTPLPDGNDSLTKQEGKFENYQEERFKQAEYDFKKDQDEEKGVRDSSAGGDGDDEAMEGDPLLEKTRARLESLYEAGNPEEAPTSSEAIDADDEEDQRRPNVDPTLLDGWTQGRIQQANSALGNTVYDDGEEENQLIDDIQREIEEAIAAGDSDDEDSNISASTTPVSGDDTGVPNDPDELDDWTKERIRNTIASRQIVTSREKLAEKKDKPPIQDNTIFQKFKQGTLVPPEVQNKNVPQGKELEPFPSREQFVGFWQTMTSPTGFPADDDGGDGSKSENLIFRVDGTTAGGPVFDPETNQKAAGGTWKITPNEDDGEKTAKVRIRLIMPPKKERILVMEGTATKRSMVSLKTLPPMASSTFGIPELQEKANMSQQEDTDLDEEKIYCDGKVWLEDAVTGNNKVDIGTFSLVKLNTPRDPSQFTITIPRPIKNQD